MGIEYAKALGLRVIVIDSGAEKKKLCMEKGAEAFVDFRECEDVVKEVRRLSGGGCQGVVVTGGTKEAYATAPKFLRKAGVQVCVGAYFFFTRNSFFTSSSSWHSRSEITYLIDGVGLPAGGTAIAGADPLLICFQKLSILGSLVAGMQEVDEGTLGTPLPALPQLLPTVLTSDPSSTL